MRSERKRSILKGRKGNRTNGVSEEGNANKKTEQRLKMARQEDAPKMVVYNHIWKGTLHS